MSWPVSHRFDLSVFDLICFDRYFFNVGGLQRDLKCAFLGESGMSIRSR